MSYGISIQGLPTFLGNERLIIKCGELKLSQSQVPNLKYYFSNPISSHTTGYNDEINSQGWFNFYKGKFDPNDCLAFVGVQIDEYIEEKTNIIRYKGDQLAIAPIKFRYNSITGYMQARVVTYFGTITKPKPLIFAQGSINIHFYVRASTITPNTGYGIHIYNERGNLVFKDGLALLKNIKTLPVRLTKEKAYNGVHYLYKLEENPLLKNIGTNKLVLNTAIGNFSACQYSSAMRNYEYFGGIITPVLTSRGSVVCVLTDQFTINGGRRSYPSISGGNGEFEDINQISEYIMYIDP